MKHLRVILIIAILLTVAVGLVVAWHARPRHARFFTDAAVIRQPVDEADPGDILWEPPRRLEQLLNTAAGEHDPRVTDDGTTLFFVRGRRGHNTDIYVSRRGPEGWSHPEPLAAVNSDADELSPEPSPDGSRLYFASNRGGGEGGYDLWMSLRNGDTWAPPVNLGEAVNTRYHEYGPALAPGGRTLYFASNRPKEDDESSPDEEAWIAAVEEDMARRDFDLYAAGVLDRGIGGAQPVDGINTSSHETAPTITPAGDFLYFASDRPGGEGGFDIYRSRRLRGSQLPPQSLGSSINTAHDENEPAAALGGFGIYFSSDRPAPPARAEDADDHDQYYTIAREVFTETETMRGGLDWAAIITALLWLLLATLLIIGLWLFARLLKANRYQKLSLLARCLLASAFVHALLLIALTFWGVSTSLADWIEDGRGIRVTIVSNNVGGDLSGQVRGSITDVSVSAPAQDSAPAPLVEEQPQQAGSAAELAVEPVNVTPVPTHEALEDAAEAPPSLAETAVSRQRPPPPEVSETVATATPAAGPRTAVAEPEAPAAQESVTVPSGRRAPAADAVTSSSIDVAVNLPPTEAEADNSSTLVDSEAPADAATSATARTQAMPTEPAATAVDQPLSIEPDLPSVPEIAAYTADEPEPQPALSFDPAPRSEDAPGESPLSPQQASVNVPPVDAAGGAPHADFAQMMVADAAEGSALPVSIDEQAQTIEAPQSAATLALPEMPLERELGRPESDVSVKAHVQGLDQPTESFTLTSATGGAGGGTVDVEVEAPGPTPEPESFAMSAPSDVSVARIPPAPQTPSTDAAQLEQELHVALPAEHLEMKSDAVEAAAAPAASARESIASRTDVVLPGPSADASQAEFAPDRAGFSLPLADEAPPEATPADTVASSQFAAPASEAAAELVPGVTIEPILPQLETEPRTAAAADRSERSPAEVAPLPASATPAEDYLTDIESPQAQLEVASDALRWESQADPGFLAAASPRDVPSGEAVMVPDLKKPDPASADELDIELPIPTQTRPEGPYAHRAPEKKQQLVERMGGTEKTERAVQIALAWFARHQHDDGHWDARGYDEGCGACGGAARVKLDVATTSLALLCFLAADHTQLSASEYQPNVKAAIDWLLRQQLPNGDLQGDESMYSHGIATIALAEAYGMTREQRLRRPIQDATDFIFAARNRQVGGWRYAPGQVGDTSVLGWQIMALTAARRAGIDVPEGAFDSGRQWLKAAGSRSREGLYSYQPDRSVSPAMTAEAMFVRQLLGEPRDAPGMDRAVRYILENPPEWDETSTYYTYYATLALYQHQGSAWQRWNERLRNELLAQQITTGRAAGSWDPNDQWAEVGGRLYQTAMCTLTLEVYYRYLPSFVVLRDEEPQK